MENPGLDSAIDSDSDLLMTILAWILGRILRIFCRRFFNMKDSGVDSAMDSDSDLMMMDSGVDSGEDSSVEDSGEDSVADSGIGLEKVDFPLVFQ